mgnify:CR=1 FL=1
MNQNRKVLKTIIKCLPLLLLGSCRAWSPAPEADMLKYELKGDVASMKNTVYKLDSTAGGYVASGIEASMSNIRVEFDTAGRTAVLEHFNRSNQLTAKEVYKYNQDGQPVSKTVVLDDGTVKERTDYSYRRGRLQSITVTDGKDSLVKHEDYIYFGRDSVKSEFSFKGDTVSGYRVTRYDSLGRNIGSVTYSARDNSVIGRMSIMYDSLGRRKSITSDDIFFKNLESRMSYGDNGFCSAMEMEGRGGRVEMRYSFKTDTAGNWTERVTYRDGSPVRVEVREISYR